MKKKILIIVPILIVALIVIIAIPKHDNIEATPKEVSETSEVSEPTQEPEITPEPEKEKTPEPQPEVTEPTNPEPVETVEDLEDGINSTHTDVELGDDEYKGDTGADALQSEYDSLSEEDQAVVKQIEEELKKEHPEWFTDTVPSTGEGNYEDVGTPDNGVIPEYTVGESGSEGLADNVTVY